MMLAMAERDRILASLRVWVATAWADGTIAGPEREALRRLISYAAITEAEKAEATSWLEQPIELEIGALHELSIVRRLFIFRVAAALTRVDDNVDSAESALLEKLRVALDIDPAEAGDIDLS
jgi:tellurite resistance protein